MMQTKDTWAVAPALLTLVTDTASIQRETQNTQNHRDEIENVIQEAGRIGARAYDR